MSDYAAKIAQAAEISAHLDQWSLFFKITVYWAVGYLLFFLWMGIVEYKRGLNKIPHSRAILWSGLIGTFALMFVAVARYHYWNDCYIHFIKYFR